MRTGQDLSSLIETYLLNIKADEQAPFLRAKAESRRLNKEGISLSRVEGEMLRFFVRLMNCQRFIEIGTLTGYSALWILLGLGAGGELWTFEKDPKHAEVANAVLAEALKLPDFQDKKIHLMEGDAETNLEKIISLGPFDGIFIDGNKSAYGRYLEWARKNLRSGGLVVCDNVFLGGSVLGASGEAAGKFSEKQISVMDQVNRDLLASDDFIGMIIPTSEGLAVAIKR
jgi:predicted O-methyltransferase YrrM